MSDNIITTTYLAIVDGTLVGKSGFQTANPKAGRAINANMAAVKRALDAGELTDLEGNVVNDGAVLVTYTLVKRVKSDTDLTNAVPTVTNAHSGKTVDIPECKAQYASPNDPGYPNAF